jgi:hypothetical protein
MRTLLLAVAVWFLGTQAVWAEDKEVINDLRARGTKCVTEVVKEQVPCVVWRKVPCRPPPQVPDGPPPQIPTPTGTAATVPGKVTPR